MFVLRGRRRAYASNSARYSDDQPRDDHGKWTGDGGDDDSGGSSAGGASGDPFDRAFQQAAIERYTGLPAEQGGTGGGRDDLSSDEKVAIEDAVRWQGTSSPEPLYRGVATAEVPNVGDQINVPWASATTELDQAAAYAENADGSHVVFEYPTGTVALDVSAQAGVPAEEERLFGGNFRVSDIGPAYEGEQDSPTLVKMELSDERWTPSPEYVAALQARSAKRYSDDQPRDKDGKWASDGGSDGSNGPESWQHESPQLGESVDPAAVFAQEAFAQGDLSEAENHAVSQYVEASSLEVNAALREGSVLNETDAETVRGLDSAIDASKTTQDVTVFRGVDASIPTTTGTTFTDHGYVSSSLREPTAAVFGSTVAEIQVPEGTNALAVSNAYGGLGDVNSEVILPRGSAFQVTGTGPTGNVLVDYVGKAVSAETATRSERAKGNAKSRFVWASGDVVVTTVEEKQEARYSDDQPRDDHGRWTGSGGDDADSGSGSGGSGAVAGVVAGLEEGQHETVSADALQATVAAMADAPNPVNLENLHVDGYGNGNLFDHSATDLPREAMPQIGNTPTAVQDFAGYLQQQGITAETTQVAPGDLHATQNQLDGREVAGIEEVIAKDPTTGFAQRTIVTAEDGAVLDGHHFWAASAVYGETHTDFRINTLQVHTDINTLLTAANKYDVTAGIGHQAFGQTGPPPGSRAEFEADAPEDPPSDDRPWLYFDGQWLLIATDTADGIPQSLDLPEKAARPEKRYSDDQPRDEHGRWTGDGSGGSSSAEAWQLNAPWRGDRPTMDELTATAEKSAAYAKANIEEEPISNADRAALEKYADTGYQPVNYWLRDPTGNGYLADQAQPIQMAMDSVLETSETTAPITVFRGMSGGIPGADVGDTFVDHGYVSTSLQENTASLFSGATHEAGDNQPQQTVAEIRIPEGAHVLSMSNAIGRDPESEVVLPHDSKFEVVSRNTESWTYNGLPNQVTHVVLDYHAPGANSTTRAERRADSEENESSHSRFMWYPGDLEAVDSEARYSDDQPRDDHGRWSGSGGDDSSSPGSTDSGLASKVVEAAESGGGTIDPRTGAEPTEGFAVAVDAHTLTADATLYHVTDASNDAAISRDGLRPAAEIGTGGLEPEMPDTYDARGVFLATAPQAEVLAQQMRDNEVEPITYAATVPEGTTVLRDALMPESSVLVPGSIPTSQLEPISDEELARRADGAEQGLEPATVDQLPLSTASSITPANEFFANGGEDGAQVTADWLRANQDLFDSNDAFHVGVWYDTAHQEVVLDPSEVFPADQRAEAIQAGIGRNQQAIYDLGAGEEIPTGGTGGRSEARTSDNGKAEEEDPRSHGRRTAGVRPRTRQQVGEGRSGQEARGELNLSLSRSAAPPPPDLREADTASNERCGTCHMHDPDTGQCWGYGNLPVSSDWVCDSYAAEPDGAS